MGSAAQGLTLSLKTMKPIYDNGMICGAHWKFLWSRSLAAAMLYISADWANVSNAFAPLPPAERHPPPSDQPPPLSDFTLRSFTHGSRLIAPEDRDSFANSGAIPMAKEITHQLRGKPFQKIKTHCRTYMVIVTSGTQGRHARCCAGRWALRRVIED